MFDNIRSERAAKRSTKVRVERQPGGKGRLPLGRHRVPVFELLERREMLSGNTYLPSATVAESTSTSDNNLPSVIAAAVDSGDANFAGSFSPSDGPAFGVPVVAGPTTTTENTAVSGLVITPAAGDYHGNLLPDHRHHRRNAVLQRRLGADHQRPVHHGGQRRRRTGVHPRDEFRVQRRLHGSGIDDRQQRRIGRHDDHGHDQHRRNAIRQSVELLQRGRHHDRWHELRRGIDGNGNALSGTKSLTLTSLSP